MKDLIKEVALEVVNKLLFEPFESHECAVFTKADLNNFATAFLAELSKRAEAVAWFYVHNETGESVFSRSDDDECAERGWTKEPLFTFPPIHDIEAIENRVAEACIKAIKNIDDGEAPEYSHCIETLGSGEWREYK